MANTAMLRSVARVAPSAATLEGGGVLVHRAFPNGALDSLDPFLLLDEMGPLELKAGKSTGFPDHPHRGFETVTYLLDGQFEHRDSFGNRGLIEPGGVQWMTAGSGLVHSEMPGPDVTRHGGRLHGFQLWVNLPRSAKMARPKYQELSPERVPAAASAGVRARVIAGEALGVRATIGTHTPIQYAHFTLDPGASHTHAVPGRYNAFAYVFRGSARFGDTPAGRGDLAVFEGNGDAVEVANPAAEPLDLLLIAGEPIGEPVARYGPFVMNTREELYQAFEDFRAGRMGAIGR
jgi:redox-sensitive bicupin YhaK (pirin superfamily)